MKIDFKKQDLYFPIAIGESGSNYLPKENQRMIVRRVNGDWEGVDAENIEQVKIVLENLFCKWNGVLDIDELDIKEGILSHPSEE